MARFARRQQRGADAVAIDAAGGRPLPADQVPCRLQVAAVTEPGQAGRPRAALISGLLVGPFPLRLVQLTIPLAPSAWPAVGAALPALADRCDPRHFGVTWVVLPASSLIPNPVNATQWQHASADAWDHGPAGAHDRAVVSRLVATKVTVDDFPAGLDETASGIDGLLRDAANPDQPGPAGLPGPSG